MTDYKVKGRIVNLGRNQRCMEGTLTTTDGGFLDGHLKIYEVPFFGPAEEFLKPEIRVVGARDGRSTVLMIDPYSGKQRISVISLWEGLGDLRELVGGELFLPEDVANPHRFIDCNNTLHALSPKDYYRGAVSMEFEQKESK